ncbi:hypothetical protein AAE478_007523 [Parahypoxylon ruwenzoriense]
MKVSTLLVGYAATQALSYPGMGRTIDEIRVRRDTVLGKRSTELLGDLLNIKEEVLTITGKAIRSILTGASAIADRNTYTPPGELASDVCKQNTLCTWYWVVDELSKAFADSEGCTDLARGAIRQGFHDAATWDRDSSYGGADGSLLLNDDEPARSDNNGLAEIGSQTRVWYDKYKEYGIGMADLIQTAAIVATVSCPGGPRIRHFVGRKDDSRPGPTGKLPQPYQDADALIELFSAKTFTASDLVALVGAHTASKQRFVDPARLNAPQDSTPAIWDTKFYSETLVGDNKTTLIFHSDKSISTYSLTRTQFTLFAGIGGQVLWSPVYAQAYFRMSMLGVRNLNDLTEITRVLPLPR